MLLQFAVAVNHTFLAFVGDDASLKVSFKSITGSVQPRVSAMLVRQLSCLSRDLDGSKWSKLPTSNSTGQQSGGPGTEGDGDDSNEGENESEDEPENESGNESETASETNTDTEEDEDDILAGAKRGSHQLGGWEIQAGPIISSINHGSHRGGGAVQGPLLVRWKNSGEAISLPHNYVVGSRLPAAPASEDSADGRAFRDGTQTRPAHGPEPGHVSSLTRAVVLPPTSLCMPPTLALLLPLASVNVACSCSCNQAPPADSFPNAWSDLLCSHCGGKRSIIWLLVRLQRPDDQPHGVP
jgi:hypothetical protein